MQLKNYQKQCLETLSEFLELSRLHNVQSAYNKIQHKRYNGNNYKPYQPLDQLDKVPYICLRIPTGGGKTLLSAHTISIAKQSFLERQNPVTLWLVPTNTIKLQTLETLQNPKHPNYHVLEEAFDGSFKVFDIAHFRQIRPQDISNSTCIIISTFASLRVDKTEGRKAYDHDENLESHFSVIPANANIKDFSRLLSVTVCYPMRRAKRMGSLFAVTNTRFLEVTVERDEGKSQAFRVPAYENQTVLDVVSWIQQNADPTLSYRFACRVGMCGSCAMMVNGVPRWTCRTHISKVLEG